MCGYYDCMLGEKWKTVVYNPEIYIILNCRKHVLVSGITIFQMLFRHRFYCARKIVLGKFTCFERMIVNVRLIEYVKTYLWQANMERIIKRNIQALTREMVSVSAGLSSGVGCLECNKHSLETRKLVVFLWLPYLSALVAPQRKRPRRVFFAVFVLSKTFGNAGEWLFKLKYCCFAYYLTTTALVHCLNNGTYAKCMESSINNVCSEVWLAREKSNF